MKTIKLGTLLLFCAVSANFIAACAARSSAFGDQSNFKKHDVVKTDQTPGAVLTIAKVKAPVYAVRPLVIKGFRDSIPEYKAIKGLTYKAYSLSDGGRYFGGIYYWTSERDAKNWFNAGWFARVEKKYGVPGTVDYYQVISVKEAAEVNQTEAGFWAVLSLPAAPIIVDPNAAGLLKAVELKDAAGQPGVLTVWNSKADAEQYFQNKQLANTFFDVPILLDNAQ